MTGKWPLLTCLASTLFMTGVIWFVQVVHYPLFGRVHAGHFPEYHADHTRFTTSIVVLPMIAELLSSFYLVFRRPEAVPSWLAWAGLGLAVASWAATFALSVPAHERLSRGFDAEVHARLVATNWIRLASWTAHAGVVLAMTARSIR